MVNSEELEQVEGSWLDESVQLHGGNSVISESTVETPQSVFKVNRFRVRKK